MQKAEAADASKEILQLSEERPKKNAVKKPVDPIWFACSYLRSPEASDQTSRSHSEHKNHSHMMAINENGPPTAPAALVPSCDTKVSAVL